MPFCDTKCNYCGFYSVTNHTKKIKEMYLSSLENELDYYLNLYQIIPETIYIGGGNPASDSLLLKKIMELVQNKITLTCMKEYTVECNPLNINKELIGIFKDYSINRVSMGIQSFTMEALEYSNRKNQSIDVIHNALSLLEEIDINISIDLISALPKTDIFYDKKELINLLNTYTKINHVSLYDLSIDEGSYFHENIPPINSSDFLDTYETEIQNILLNNGFNQYEISNYSRRSNHESLHNKAYWQYKNYIGLGPGAHGKIDSMRHENQNSLDNYNSENINLYKISSIITPVEMLEEILLMGLRINEGIELCLIKKLINDDDKYEKFMTVIRNYSENQYLSVKDNSIYSTKKGWKILNSILVDLFITLSN